ncbi:MAG: hypothetical protein WA802_10990 [Terracidiphilus sp.]
MKSAEKMFAAVELRPVFNPPSAGGGSRGICRALRLALLMALPWGLAQAQAQQSGAGQLPDHSTRPGEPSLNQIALGDEHEPLDEQKRVRAINAALHKSMVSDTDKLLKLVKELNAEIGSTNPASLTPEELRMVAEIEKLAHGVKDKMRTPAPAPSSLMDASPSMTQPARH